MSDLALTYSMAEQEFERCKSLGVLNVSLELARRLAQRREITRLHILGNSSLEAQLASSTHVDFASHDEATRSRMGRILWDQYGLYEATKRAGNGLLLLPKGFASFVRMPPVPLITFVHDVIMHRYERSYPHGFPLLERTYFSACFRASLRHSSLILTNSEFTTSELRSVAASWQQPLPPIVTVGIGISAESPPPGARQSRIVVLVSRLPHKRSDLAVQYLTRWARETGFAGPVDWIGTLPRGCTLPPFHDWRVHPRLPDGDYKRRIRSAQALVYFSEYEGFGMPPVEAAAYGTAPVYSSIPATVEVMSGVGYPFDNRSYDSFAAAMSAAMQAEPAQVLQWGRLLLARHSWDAVVDRVTRALAQVAA